MSISPSDITVVIPTYNRSALATRAVESALDQTVRPAEIIVVDDGSTDDTPAALGGYEAPVRMIRQANAGSSAARNCGVEAAHTDWIAFLDSDDVWRTDHLERSLVAMRETTCSADLYFSDVLTRFPATMTTSTEGERLFALAGADIGDQPFEFCSDGTDWAMRSFQPMLLQASLIRRDRYLDLGGLRRELQLRHDVHLFLRLSLGHPVVAMNHIGTEMTADDGESRLSVTHGEDTEQYALETALLYRDVLAATPNVRRETKIELSRRLANAELRLARLAASDRAIWTCLRHLVNAGVASPSTLTRRIAGRRS